MTPEFGDGRDFVRVRRARELSSQCFLVSMFDSFRPSKIATWWVAAERGLLDRVARGLRLCRCATARATRVTRPEREQAPTRYTFLAIVRGWSYITIDQAKSQENHIVVDNWLRTI